MNARNAHSTLAHVRIPKLSVILDGNEDVVVASWELRHTFTFYFFFFYLPVVIPSKLPQTCNHSTSYSFFERMMMKKKKKSIRFSRFSRFPPFDGHTWNASLSIQKIRFATESNEFTWTIIFVWMFFTFDACGYEIRSIECRYKRFNGRQKRKMQQKKKILHHGQLNKSFLIRSFKWSINHLAISISKWLFA